MSKYKKAAVKELRAAIRSIELDCEMTAIDHAIKAVDAMHQIARAARSEMLKRGVSA